jgi:hypothetical protein
MVASLQLDLLEGTRIAIANKVAAAKRNGLEDDPTVAYLETMADGIGVEEHQAELALCRALRASAFADFQKRSDGVGEKQLARLLASIAVEPYWHTLYNRPRLVSELWSYCGVGDAARQTRQSGHQSNWNPEARKRLFVIAESCMKRPKTSPYRVIYDQAREKYADAIHAHPCAQCGGGGHRGAETQEVRAAAPAGTPLRDGHKHRRALRAIEKAFALDLWEEGRRLHDGGHGDAETQDVSAPVKGAGA